MRASGELSLSPRSRGEGGARNSRRREDLRDRRAPGEGRRACSYSCRSAAFELPARPLSPFTRGEGNLAPWARLKLTPLGFARGIAEVEISRGREGVYSAMISLQPVATAFAAAGWRRLDRLPRAKPGANLLSAPSRALAWKVHSAASRGGLSSVPGVGSPLAMEPRIHRSPIWS